LTGAILTEIFLKFAFPYCPETPCYEKCSALLFSCLTLLLPAQEFEKREYTTTRTENPPVINGVPDDAAWTEGEWSGDFWQYEPAEGAPVSQKTEFKLLYDDYNIYYCHQAYDTAPDSIVSRMTRRDDIDGDQVTVAFDSYFDQRTAFGFSVSASGVKGDLIWTDDGMSEDETFDPIWYVKTGIYDWGWAAEMRIPLTQLRFSDKLSRYGDWKYSGIYTDTPGPHVAANCQERFRAGSQCRFA
jgi:hypothetical protein